MIEIIRIPAFKDNYIWLLFNSDTHQGVVVDPGEAQGVLDKLSQQHIHLVAILITHHHWDHTGGISALVEKTQAPVFGPRQDPIPGLTQPLEDNQMFNLIGIQFNVLEIPGHTLGHIAYYGDNRLFCGDTLFTAGCGRLFEGTPEQLLNSLSKLKALPETTEIYCGHEYTLNNLEFAITVEPYNEFIQQRLESVRQLRQKDRATVPAPLSIELKTNPLLRTQFPSVKAAVEKHFAKSFSSEVEIFAALRQWKDHFTIA